MDTSHAESGERKVVLGGGDAEHVVAGTVMFREGEPGDVMYGVRTGEVALRVGDSEVEVARTGDFLGELALVDRGPRSARAIAKTDCELVRVDEKRFQFMVTQTPFFAPEVMRVMAARLRRWV